MDKGIRLGLGLGFAAILMLLALLAEASAPVQTAVSATSQANRASTQLTDTASNSESIEPAVLQNQPLLLIDPEDLERNHDELLIHYCVNSDSTATYYTYIYEWTFSDTPMWSELLGYPDHNWDYEPVIAVIDHSDGSLTYIYDSGHYRAARTSSKYLAVSKGTHNFATSDSGLGESFGEEAFCTLTPGRLSMMNEQLAELPRLPFGSKLSLQWACNEPAKVVSKGKFSADEVGGKLPVQVNLVGGALIGCLLSILAWMFTVLTKSGERIPITKVVVVGTFSGLAAGITGGSVSDMALNYFHNIAASVCSGFFVGALAGLVVYILLCHNVSRSWPISVVSIVQVSSILVALTVSLW